MNTDDPEERIRQLEQFAAQQGAVGNARPAGAGKGIPGGLVLGMAAIFVVIVLCGVGAILWNVLSSVL